MYSLIDVNNEENKKAKRIVKNEFFFCLIKN